MPVNSSTTLFLTLSVISAFLCANASPKGPHGKHDWCYKDDRCSPTKWAGQCQTGKSQSPVDFNGKNVIDDKKELRLRFNKEYAEIQEHFYVKNNGHTLQVQLKEDFSSKLLMDGDGLKGSYVFSQLHFHWGSHDDVGSEHTVKGVSHPAELHLVHYGATFASLKDAASDSSHRALAVLGIFLELSNEDNPSFKPIIEAMDKAMDVSDDLKSIHSSINITALLPAELGLYRYYGSLTTPSCNEIVHWNVFRQPVPISRKQLETFRNMRDSDENKLVDNFRPTLPTGTRKIREHAFVLRGFKSDGDSSEDKSLTPDADYDDSMKDIEGDNVQKIPNIKPKTHEDNKKNSAGGLGSAISTLALIVSRFVIIAQGSN